MVNDVQSLRELMARVKKAQEKYSTFDQTTVIKFLEKLHKKLMMKELL